jgi:hypothetical protein
MRKINSKFDLDAMGVTEMSVKEMKAVEGGSLFGKIFGAVISAIATIVCLAIPGAEPFAAVTGASFIYCLTGKQIMSKQMV